MLSLEYYQTLRRNLEELILEEPDDRRIFQYLTDYIKCLEQIGIIRTEIEKLTFTLN